MATKYFTQTCKRCGGYGEDQEYAVTCLDCRGVGKVPLNSQAEKPTEIEVQWN